MQRPLTLSMSNPLRKEGESAALYAANRKIRSRNWAALWHNKNRSTSSISSASRESKDWETWVMWTDGTQKKRFCSFSTPISTVNAEAWIWNQIMNTRRFCQRGVWAHVWLSTIFMWTSHRHTIAPQLIVVPACDPPPSVPSYPFLSASSICVSSSLSHRISLDCKPIPEWQA